MLSADLQKKLMDEFDVVEKGRNPKITSDIEAIVVLSGESLDPAIKTDLHDTEERLAEGIRIYQGIQKLEGSPILVLNGTDPQNIFMEAEAKRRAVDKVMIVKNPSYPAASTKTQIEGLKKLKFKKIAIVTHAYHGPRVLRYARKFFLNNCKFTLFLIARDKINKNQVQQEIEKIIEYASKGDIDLKNNTFQESE